MLKEPHPIVGRSEFLLKRWKKYTIYSKLGSYIRSDNPSEVSVHSSSIRQLTSTINYTVPDSPKANVYSTNSIYLYDYVIVSDTFFLNNVYTSSTADSTPSLDYSYAGSNQWNHMTNTWHDSPNARENNFIWRYNPGASVQMGRPIYGYYAEYTPLVPIPISPYNGVTIEEYQELMETPVFRDDGTYFEIVRGYPRNHYTHKKGYFSLERYTSYGLSGRTVTSSSYRKGEQLNTTTIGPDGISDGSDPVQTTQVTNIDLIKSDNVIYH